MKHLTNNVISDFMNTPFHSDLHYFSNWNLLMEVIETLKEFHNVDFSIDNMSWVIESKNKYFISKSKNFKLGVWEAVMECIKELSRKEEDLFKL